MQLAFDVHQENTLMACGGYTHFLAIKKPKSIHSLTYMKGLKARGIVIGGVPTVTADQATKTVVKKLAHLINLASVKYLENRSLQQKSS